MGKFNIAKYFRVEHALYLIPLCCLAVYDSVFSSFSSVLARLAEAYPDAPTVVIQMVLTAPSIMYIPATLVSGVLSQYIRKKIICVFALCVMGVGGFLPVFASNPPIQLLFASSLMIGLGQGLLSPLSSAMVCEYYDDSNRGKVLGFKQAANYVGAATVTIVVGYLAVTNWSDAYLVYIGVIPIIIFSIVFLPRGGLDRKLVERGSRAQGIKDVFTPAAVYVFILFALATVCSFSWHTNVAMMVSEKGLGNSADVAKITSLNYIIGFVVGIIYGRISSVLKGRTAILGFFLCAVGLLVAALGPTFPVIMLGGAIVGFGSGIVEISTLFFVSSAVKKKSVTMALSIGMSFVNVGITFSPAIIGFFKTLFGFTTAGQGMIVGAVGFLVLCLVDGFYRSFINKDWDPNLVDGGE